MSDERKVRTLHGLTRWRGLEDHRFSIQKIKEWREAESHAGRPHELSDFYATHGLCFDCTGNGVQMIGWSKPSDAEIKDWTERGLTDFPKDLPLYEICSTCKGTGTADRSQWQKIHLPRISETD